MFTEIAQSVRIKVNFLRTQIVQTWKNVKVSWNIQVLQQAVKEWYEILFSFFIASSTQCQNEHFDGDVKESDHLKKIPISGYIHDTSPVKPSRNNYMYFNFKFQTANGFCDAVCFDKSLHNQVKQKDETQKSVRLSNYSLKRSLENNNDMTIVVNKRTKIENISECPFNYKAPIKQF